LCDKCEWRGKVARVWSAHAMDGTDSPAIGFLWGNALSINFWKMVEFGAIFNQIWITRWIK